MGGAGGYPLRLSMLPSNHALGDTVTTDSCFGRGLVLT